MCNISRRTIFRAATAFCILPLVSSNSQAKAMPTIAALEPYSGKLVYLDFWASWCGPCKLSFPFMHAITAKYSAKELSVVTVNLDRSRASAEKFLHDVNSSLPVIFDQEGQIAKQFGVADMPTSYLIDRNGEIRFIHKGFYTDRRAEYEAHVDQLLQQ
jgi:thiol-disulfide isomerase/thioredoxin